MALPAGGAIQARKYSLDHELAVAVGSMPSDPFEKGWAVGLSYTIHASDSVAWELFNATAVYLTPTTLQKDLIADFDRRPEDFSAPRAMITSGLVIAPFYGKMSLLDGLVVHQSLFAGAHAGLVFGDRPSALDTLRDLRPAVGLGIGYRLFFGEVISLRLEARDFLAFRPVVERGAGRFEQVLLLSAALAIALGGGEE